MITWQNVIDRANSDPQFRSRLKSNPAATCKEAGVSVPPGATVKVIERQPSEIYLVLGPPGGALGDAELEGVAGGTAAGISHLTTISTIKADEANQDAIDAGTPKTPAPRPTPPKPTRPR